MMWLKAQKEKRIMKRKVLTGMAAAVLSAVIPMSSTVNVLAQEQQGMWPEKMAEKEFAEPKEFNGELPPEMNGERPEFNGELPPEMNGERPEFNGELPPEMNGERPEFNGELPPEMNGERPEFNGELPPDMNGEIPEGFGKGRAPGRRLMPRKSDAEALAEGNPAQELPEGVTAEEK